MDLYLESPIDLHGVAQGQLYFYLTVEIFFTFEYNQVTDE
jgi:hypothetical protein